MATEHVVAQADQFQDGQMKQVQAGETKILLVRVAGQFYAVSPTCPHQGAPLDEGVTCEGHVRCPWHQSLFDIRNGDLLQPPAMDGLTRYDVRVQGADVIVTLPGHAPAALAAPTPTATGGASARTFVIIGSGAAGMIAAETLRADGFDGRVLMLTREADPPYDRTELSKFYLRTTKGSPPMLRGAEFYKAAGIELLTRCEIVDVDAAAHSVTCRDGRCFKYDRLLLASGAEPQLPGVEGETLAGVLRLRSLANCEAIRKVAVKGRRAVIVGASFIGMETAAALRQRGVAVTVIAPEAVPFARTLGPEIGAMLQKLHESKGVSFRLNSRVARFVGADGVCQAVELEGGEQLPADFVVVGVGVRPQTGFLKSIPLNPDGSVTADSSCRVAEDVYAAGDIATVPDWRDGLPIRIEHWCWAQITGRAAADAMAGREPRDRGVPFFWTYQYKTIVQYVGFARQWDQWVIDGDVAGAFVAYYLRDGHVLAVAGANRDRQIALAAEVLSAEATRTPSLDTVRQRLATIVS